QARAGRQPIDAVALDAEPATIEERRDAEAAERGVEPEAEALRRRVLECAGGGETLREIRRARDGAIGDRDARARLDGDVHGRLVAQHATAGNPLRVGTPTSGTPTPRTGLRPYSSHHF